MRNLKNLILVVLILLTSVSTYASVYPSVNPGNAKSLVVDLNDWAVTDLNISIIDEDNNVLINDVLEAGAHDARKYNLKNLRLGDYKLIIDGNKKVAIHSIEVDFNSVNIKAEDARVFFRPKIEVEKNTISLNLLALNEKVSVSISDQKGTFFLKEYKGENSINARFDISSLPVGEYSFSISTKDQYEVRSFEK